MPKFTKERLILFISRYSLSTIEERLYHDNVTTVDSFNIILENDPKTFCPDRSESHSTLENEEHSAS